MTTYTYIGGPLDQASSYTVGGMTPMNPPGSGDDIDFPSGGSPTGSVDVAFVSVEGALTLTGDLTTGGVFASAPITINAGGDLDSTASLYTSAAMTVQNGGQLEADGATFDGPSFTVDGSGSSYTDQGDFIAEGPTTVTFSNGAQVMTGADPGDTDVVDGGSFTVTTGAMLTATAIATADGMTWTFDQNATLTLTGGGNLALGGAVGADLNGTGTIDDATINSQGGWAIGGSGLGIGSTGVATFQDNAQVTVASLYLGDFSGDSGTLTVSGAATLLMIEGDTSIASSAGLLLVGNDGTGNLTINQGSTVIDTITSTLADSTVGYGMGSTGTVVVDGDTTSWQTMGTLDVGGDGFGQVTVQNKGSMTATQLDIAEQSDSGTNAAPDLVTITGDGSSLTVSDELDVGAAGVGALLIESGGAVTITSSGTMALVVGDTAMAVGTVTVTDPGSVLTTDGTAIVGNGGLGTLDIENQGSAMLGALLVAAMSTSGTTTNPDMVTVDGSGSTLVVSNSVTVDSALPSGFTGGAWSYTASGDGEITVTNGGYMSIGQTLSLQAPSAPMTPPVLTIVSGGYVEVGGNNPAIADTLYIGTGGRVIGHGTIESVNTSTDPTMPAWSLNVVDDGTIDASKGLLKIDGNINGDGTVQISNEATLELGGSFGSVGANGTIDFLTSDQHTLVLDDPTDFNGSLNGVGLGDQIIIPISALSAGDSIIAAPIVQMGGTQTLLIFEGTSIVPTTVFPNIPIEGTAGGDDLAGDYFDITQNGSDDILTLTTQAPSNFIINEDYDDSVANLAPDNLDTQMNFEIGVEAAVLFYQSEIQNSMTVTMNFGWGEVDNDDSDAITGNALGESITSTGNYTYAQLYAAVQATDTNSLVQTTAAALLPATDPTGGSIFRVTMAEQQALGLTPNNDFQTNYNDTEGSIGLGSGIAWSWIQQETSGDNFDAVGTLEHEISEVLGRTATGGAPESDADGGDEPGSGPPAYELLDMYRYTAIDGGDQDAPGTAVGQRDEPFNPNYIAVGPIAPGSDQPGSNAYAYFSWNGQTVTLEGETPEDIADHSDVMDWAPSVPNDSFADGGPDGPDIVSAYDLQVMNILGYDIPSVTCFAAGTRILTERGEVPVRDLRIGDLVRTRLNESLTPVVWIGRRRVNCARHPDPRKVWPVRVRAGAFGDGMPHRDLWLSPDHAVHVNDVLIPIKYLINGTSIAQVAVDEITYYHVELPRHDVLLAEGLPAESYLDAGDRYNFDNHGDVIRLHADFATPRMGAADVWEAAGCAPLVVRGPILEDVRSRLAVREISRSPRPHRQRKTA
jgi:T5SS/PEP-CTERM-associated repeat protein